MITVILNAFKRQKHLKRQIKSVLDQSVETETILIWNNGVHLDISNHDNKIVVANSSFNFGVWSRFAFALNANTEFVCVLDDDTFPQKHFFENCLEQMEKEPALLGARGLRFLSPNRYHPFNAFGWDSPNEVTEVVDIVGHAWFFKREWLSAFWREQPAIGVNRLIGEDIHFSYMLQKYMDISTMVPPHPKGKKNLWGSDPFLGKKLGTSDVAISQGDGALRKFDEILRTYTSAGFKLHKDSEKDRTPDLILGPGISRVKFIQQLSKKYPKFRAFGRKVQKKLSKYKIFI